MPFEGPPRRKFSGKRLVLASHNAGKIVELTQLLEPLGIAVVSAAALGLAEPEETGATFEENAALKALAAVAGTAEICLADDSGLAVAALDGAPGIYSARWAGPARNFDLAMEQVHDRLGTAADRSAHFVCSLALAWPDRHVEIVTGNSVAGHLIWPPRGDQGFGYDPMFQPVNEVRTFGEMPAAEKHPLSHRAAALNALLSACFETL